MKTTALIICALAVFVVATQADGSADTVVREDGLVRYNGPLPKEIQPAAPKVDGRAALAHLDADIAAQKALKQQILKKIQKQALKKKQAAGNDGFSKLSALSKQYTAQLHSATTRADLVQTSPRHTMKQPENVQPVRYSPIPTTPEARKKSADLASGAQAARKEDWMVHKATYEALHPPPAKVAKEEEKKKELKVPTPLKDAQGSYHKGLDNIHDTKKIMAMPLVKLTLDGAKSKCTEIRALAKKKCDTSEHDTKFLCLKEKTTKKVCNAQKMKDAADCKVAHETAMDKCYSLWHRAKGNIQEARKKAAAPMQHTDEQVTKMAKGTTECSTLMTKADATCKAEETKYSGECKSVMATAVEASLVSVNVAPAADGSTDTSDSDAAKAAAKASSDQLKDAEESLTKETASPALASAIDKCALKKNVYKRKCIQAIHEARDSCDKLTSAFSDDGNTSR